MQHVQIMRAAAPIFNANPDGGVYLMTLSVAVMPSLLDIEIPLIRVRVYILVGAVCHTRSLRLLAFI
jgi:hypothetical protein